MASKESRRLDRHLNNVRGARALNDEKMEREYLANWIGSEKNTMTVEELTKVLIFIYQDVRPSEAVLDVIVAPYITSEIVVEEPRVTNGLRFR
jgi:hypothetical protein